MVITNGRPHWVRITPRNLAQTEIEELRALMEYSNPDQGSTVRAISTSVNSVANDGPQLIEPITLGEPETLF